jgi:hypothetical protein
MINIGIGIGWAKAIYSVANNIIANFKARVATYPGSIFEAGPCLDTTLEELNAIGLLDNASLVITPNAYNETKLYSVVPNTALGDMDVVRATTATRVNELGLIEVVPRNLLTYSLNLSSGYAQNQCTIGASQTDPFGTSNAKRITNAAVVTDSYFEQSINFSPNTYTWSIYVKQGTALTATIRPVHVGIGGDVSVMTFTFATETTTSSGAITTRGFTKLTNGWYRIYCSVNVTSAVSSLRGRFGNPSVANVYNDWAFPQLEVSSTATTFFPTTTRLNIPRIDYTNGSCPSILVEPQRTNLILYSEEFNNASWFKSQSSITANSINSPSGNLNADTFIANGTSNTHSIATNSISFISGTTYTMSVFAKKNTNNFIQFVAPFGVGGMFANFDLNNGVVGTVGTSSGSNPISSIQNYGNGWYRCNMIFTSTTTASSSSSICLVASASAVRAESNSLSTSVYLWGAQLEAGSNATSYIPTVASTVTRNADVISKTGISSLIGQTEGAIFIDANISTRSNTRVLLDIQDGINNDAFQFVLGGNTLAVNIFDNGTLQAGLNGGFCLGRKKIALGYKLNDFVLYIDGVQVATDTSGTIPTTSLLALGYLYIAGGFELSDSINSNILFKTRLTNAELAQLTTL